MYGCNALFSWFGLWGWNFIAGLTDAEGTLYIDKYHGLTLEVSNTDHDLLMNVKSLLDSLMIKNYLVSEMRQGRAALYRIRIRGTYVSQYLREISILHPRFNKYSFMGTYA